MNKNASNASPWIQPYQGQRDAAMRRRLYAGDVYRLPATSLSRRMVRMVWDRLERELGPEPRMAQFQLDGGQLFRAAGKLRSELYQSTLCRMLIVELLRFCGFDPREHVCDPARLRVVTVGGHHVEAAAPVYFGHRDTWYSNPQCQITWWLCLHEVTHRETFEFLPDCFDQAVPNDSEGFDYDRWTSRGTDLKIGWQDREAGKRELYPRLTMPLPNERRVPFAAQPGEVIVFSGQHLHQTIPIESGSTRFSLDFRTVCLDENERGCGPVNVDNRSTGDALAGHVSLDAYVSPETGAHG